MAASDSPPGDAKPGGPPSAGNPPLPPDHTPGRPIRGDARLAGRAVPAPPPPRGGSAARRAPTTGETSRIDAAAGGAGREPTRSEGPGPGAWTEGPGDGPSVTTAPVAAITETRRPLRYRVLPRSAIGISIAILAFALGASLSGVVLYSYYEYRLTKNEAKVSQLTNQLPNEVKKAQDQLRAQEAEAQALITQQIAPLKSVLATGETLQNLVSKSAPALYFVHTLDSSGQPAVGTAFAVASDSRQTLLLTSYTVVQAATRRPGPDVFVRHGGNDEKVTVFTWQENRDLALIVLPTGSQPKLDFAPAAPKPGERVFAMSGLGAQGASITQGFVADVSAEGIQHDARTGTQFQGGPLLNSDGKVVGILSRTFSPLGFPVADVYFAVPPKAACEKVLQCPNGTPANPTGNGGSQ